MATWLAERPGGVGAYAAELGRMRVGRPRKAAGRNRVPGRTNVGYPVYDANLRRRAGRELAYRLERADTRRKAGILRGKNGRIDRAWALSMIAFHRGEKEITEQVFALNMRAAWLLRGLIRLRAARAARNARVGKLWAAYVAPQNAEPRAAAYAAYYRAAMTGRPTPGTRYAGSAPPVRGYRVGGTKVAPAMRTYWLG